MGKIDTVKVGVVGFGYPSPPELDGEAKIEWMIERCSSLGLKALHTSRAWEQVSDETLKRLGDLARSKGVELEYRMSRAIFQLGGADAKDARQEVLKFIRTAQLLGTRIVRNGYGELNLPTSRFNRDWPLKEHIRYLSRSLKEAARIMEDHDILFAIENHCDFTGKEFAEIMSAVDSPNVGVALDTANGFTVFYDPYEEVRLLAPWTITTHLKDMRIVENPNRAGVPFVAKGCALGEGYVDIPWVIDELARNSPHAERLHLIIEITWVPVTPNENRAEVMADAYHRSIDFLNGVLKKLPMLG